MAGQSLTIPTRSPAQGGYWVTRQRQDLVKRAADKLIAANKERSSAYDLDVRAQQLFQESRDIFQLLQSGEVTAGCSAWNHMVRMMTIKEGQARELERQSIQKSLRAERDSAESEECTRVARSLEPYEKNSPAQEAKCRRVHYPFLIKSTLYFVT